MEALVRGKPGTGAQKVLEGKDHLDIFNLDAVEQFLRKHDPSLLVWSWEDAERDEAGAARVVLGMLRADPALRRRFPHALTDGAASAFLQWFCRERASAAGLSPRALEHVRGVFTRDPFKKVFHVFLHLPSLHKSRPLAVTPAGGKSFARWLLRQGRAKYGLGDEEILWFLQRAAENPWPLLVAHYLVQPDWQAQFPSALAVAGLPEWLHWLQNEHGLSHLRLAQWTPVLRPVDELELLKQHRLDLQDQIPQNLAMTDAGKLATLTCRDLPHALRKRWQENLTEDIASGLANSPGVNVIGHFSYPSGLQRAAVAISHSLKCAGYRISERDQPAALRSDTLERSAHLGMELHDITLSVVAPFDPIEKRYQQGGLRLRPGVHRVGVWYWELDRMPAEWIERAASLQELWAPSRFIAEAMRSAMPVPVIEMPPGVLTPELRPFPRSNLGLADRTFVFLFMFDMCSVMERKNPLGLIKAFREAFHPNQDVALVIKVLRGSAFPEDLARLRQAASAAGVILMDRALSQEETHGLINACDAYISLHRSEGFGLTLAEAMLLGKPVIATGYSGNLDFMNAQNSLLVDCDLVPIEGELQFYTRGNRWAEPSARDAVEKMRHLVQQPAAAHKLGQRARETATVTFSMEAAAHRMIARIDQIRNLRRCT